jgi:hypothetical protein
MTPPVFDDVDLPGTRPDSLLHHVILGAFAIGKRHKADGDTHAPGSLGHQATSLIRS